MRSFTTLFAIVTLAVFTLGQNIPFRKDLSCGACAIGGFRFCYNGKSQYECCKADDANCIKTYNECTNVDKLKAVYNICSLYFRNNDVCGRIAVRQIKSTTTIYAFNITNMPIVESCSYKVYSECAWPKVEINSTEVNIFFNAFKGNISDSSYSDDSSIFGMGKAEKGKTVAMPDLVNRTVDCETEIRMYVTITRVMPVTPAPSDESFLTEESRVLQASDPSYLVTITGNLAALFKASFATFFGVLAVLAL